MRPKFFATPQAFRAWLEEHHADSSELLVGFYKKESRRPSITWTEAVDQALCFGWIDGVRKGIDEQSFTVRFTPRKPGSTWSAVNIARVARLESEGSMKPDGRKAFARRTERKSRTYSYERQESPELDAPLSKMLKANKAAWAFFQEQAPSYRRKAIHWVVSAKAEDIRVGRLRRLIDLFARGRRP